MHSPTKRALALGGIPAAAVLVLVAVVATRREAELAPPKTAAPKATPPASTSMPQMAVPAPRPKPAPDSVIAEKTEEARIRTTFMNYRTAVATDNAELQKILEPVLRRDRDVALRMAREEQAHATEPLDQSIARKVVEALRN